MTGILTFGSRKEGREELREGEERGWRENSLKERMEVNEGVRKRHGGGE